MKFRALGSILTRLDGLRVINQTNMYVHIISVLKMCRAYFELRPIVYCQLLHCPSLQVQNIFGSIPKHFGWWLIDIMKGYFFLKWIQNIWYWLKHKKNYPNNSEWLDKHDFCLSLPLFSFLLLQKLSISTSAILCSIPAKSGGRGKASWLPASTATALIVKLTIFS